MSRRPNRSCSTRSLRRRMLGSGPRLEAQQRQVEEERDFKKVYEIDRVLDLAMQDKFQEEIARTLTLIFEFMFAAKMIQFTTEEAPHVLELNYRVRPTPSLFYRTKQKQLPLPERDWYVGARFDWEIEASSDAIEVQSELNSLPAHAFSAEKNAERQIFGGMAVSAFASFGQGILTQWGLDGQASSWKQRAEDGMTREGCRQSFHELIEEVADGRSVQDVFDDHREAVDDFLALLHAEFDGYADRMVEWSESRG